MLNFQQNNFIFLKNLKTIWSLFIDQFSSLKAREPQGNNLLLTTEPPRVPGTHLIDFRRMKG